MAQFTPPKYLGKGEGEGERGREREEREKEEKERENGSRRGKASCKGEGTPTTQHESPPQTTGLSGSHFVLVGPWTPYSSTWV
jgi:hypothetical protein